MNPENTPDPGLTRRHFLAHAAVAAGWLALGRGARATETSRASARPILGFTKPLGRLAPAELAAFAAEAGWDSIECPLRSGEQVEPARVDDELPALLGALRAHGLGEPLFATDITSLREPHAESVLRALSRAGIRRLRLGGFRYSLKRSPAEELPAVGAALRDLAAACSELGLQAGVQNHSGRRFVGAGVWDLLGLLRDLDPRHVGICYDIGHGTVENGLAWPASSRVAAPHFTAVFVKDFRWERQAQGWRPSWCPLGEGMVDREFFDWLKSTGWSGPVCQHYEYPLGDRSAALAAIRRDVKTLRGWLA
jgi:sugar phosphate isomerase/epimerase